MTTLQDLANELGLHVSTVSRALAGRPGVSAEKRRRVQQAAQRHNYQPNALARGLRSKRHKVVGLVFPNIVNELYSASATILAAILWERGYVTQLSITHDDRAAEREALLSLAEHQVSGIVLAPCGPRHADVVRALKRIPVVEFMRGTQARADRVLWEDDEAAYAATKHLTDLGHRDVRFITGAAHVTTTAERVAGFKRALAEVGVDVPTSWVRLGRTVSDWEEASWQVVSEVPRCTAVIASNHLIVLKVLAACRNAGLEIPADLSLIGLDDPEWFSAIRDGITGAHVPWGEMAETAGRILLARMGAFDDGDYRLKPTIRVFPAPLIIRGSTATPIESAESDAYPSIASVHY
jgi:DNA-binding LacI/PurR family transcriptional regulator